MTPLMDIPAAAAVLGVSESWLRKRVTKREVPHTRVGKNVRFAEHHLAKIVADGEQAPQVPRQRGGRRTSL